MTVNHFEIKSRCRVCNGPLVRSPQSERVCLQCGAVDSPLLVPAFSSIERTAIGKKFGIIGDLGSYVDFSNRLYSSSSKHHRWRRLNSQSKVHSRETDLRALQALHRASALLELSYPIRDRAAYLYNTVSSAERLNKIEKISNHITLAALCLLMAIRDFVIPIRLPEVAKIFLDLGHTRTTGRSIFRLAQRLPSELGLSLKRAKSEDYLQRIISMILEEEEIQARLQLVSLDLQEYSQRLLRLSRELLQEIPSWGGINPYIFAVSVVYTAGRLLAKQTGRILTQRHLAEICQVAEYSIRDHFRVLKERLKEE